MTQEASSHEDPTTPHEAARLYASLGYRVVPIGIGKKWPELPAWQQAATNDPAMIDNWWTGIYKGHGVGLLMGHDRLFAVDIDVAHGHDGLETLKDLQDSYSPLPDTVQAETPSGGYHLIYRAPPGVAIRNDAGKRLGPGIDIRGEGGQIVAMPTTREDGRAYVWVWGCAPWERTVADAPGWLIALLTRDDPPTGEGSTAQRACSEEAWGETRPTPPQDRPGDRFNQATTWETLLATDGWTRTRNGPQGEQRWTRPGKATKDGISATVGWAGTDLLKVFTSSVPGLDPDATYSRFGYWAATRFGGDHGAAARSLAALEPRRSLNELIGTWTRDDPAEAGSSGPGGQPTGSAEPGGDQQVNGPGLFRWRITWPDFWRREHTDENWHLAPVLARGRGHAIWAGAKTGKSYHVLPIALAIATGRAHLDKPTTTPEPVIYMDYEMTEDDIHERLTEFGYGPDDDLEHLHYISLPSIPGLDTPEGALYVVEAVQAIGATAVIIDTISRAVKGPENDADTFRAFYRETGQALKHLGVTWARLDHGGKALEQGQRGSSAKNDDVDVVWKLSRTDSGMRFTSTHRRMAWVPEKVDVNVTEDDDGVMTFKIPLVMGVPEGTRQLIAELDRLEVPHDHGRDKVRRVLKKHGIKATNDVLSAAIKARKPVREPSGQVVADLISDELTGSPDRSTNPQVTALGQVDGQVRTGTPSVSADRSVPLGTDSPHADRWNPFDDTPPEGPR